MCLTPVGAAASAQVLRRRRRGKRPTSRCPRVRLLADGYQRAAAELRLVAKGDRAATGGRGMKALAGWPPGSSSLRDRTRGACPKVAMLEYAP